MSKKVQRAYAKFARLAAINAAIDAGGSEAAGMVKAKRKLADSWTKRNSSNTDGTWKAKNSKPGAVIGGKHA